MKKKVLVTVLAIMLVAAMALVGCSAPEATPSTEASPSAEASASADATASAEASASDSAEFPVPVIGQSPLVILDIPLEQITLHQLSQIMFCSRSCS